MFDTNYVHCRKKTTITPERINYAYPTDFGTNKSTVLTLTQCDGRTIPISSVLGPTGLSIVAVYYFDVAT